MITPSEIRDKCNRIWQSEAFWVSSIDRGFDIPPIEIPFGKLKPREMLNDFSTASVFVATLRAESKDNKGYGYSIDFVETNHRQLGQQKVPGRIYFETGDDFLRFINKRKEYETFLQLATSTVEVYPVLRGWLEKNPQRLIDNKLVWHKIIVVVKHFQANPSPHLYLRQLDIPGIDTKFIENNQGVIRVILDTILHPDYINHDITGLVSHGFERRFNLLHDEKQVRFRLLDKKLIMMGTATDFMLPASQFNTLNLPCKRLFFTENKINMLCFPDVDDSIVVFGGGYGISILKEASWLHDKEIYYWGDIDTHGFSILSQLRGYFPHVHSFLMDAQTLEEFKPQWGEEDEDKRCLIELSNLTSDEWQIYSYLRDNVPGKRVRLEQEKIGFGYLCNLLQKIQR